MERYVFNPEKASRGGGLTDYLGWARRNDVDLTKSFPAEFSSTDRGGMRLKIHKRDGSYLTHIHVTRDYFDKVPTKPFKAEDWL